MIQFCLLLSTVIERLCLNNFKQLRRGGILILIVTESWPNDS